MEKTPVRNAATPNQIRALQIEFKKLTDRNDPRVAVNGYRPEREARMVWAKRVIGRNLESWNEMTFAQAAYCLDYLYGITTKLDKAIDDEVKRNNITDVRAWFAAIKPAGNSTRGVWTFGNRDFDNLNFIDKCALVKLLKSRNHPWFNQRRTA